MENQIKMINVERINPHPNNPRKNVGDVTELSESIKKSGIMQNLTVVPFVNRFNPEEKIKGEYTVVIGHRRLAAAKKAGISEVPCVIKEMTQSEQLATMLAENVQRSDLTPLEQAEGIQMMLDIGESVNEIVSKTGLSETTVRRRVKLLEMDLEKLRSTEGREATLKDYERLNQIEDIKERNRVLETIGTNNFEMELKSVIDKQEKEKHKARLFEVLDTFAKKVTTYPSGYSYQKCWDFSASSEIEVPETWEEDEFCYYPNSYNVVLYKKTETKKLSKEESRKQKERKAELQKEEERKNAVKDLAKRAYDLRVGFVKDFVPTSKHADIIMRMLWSGAWHGGAEIDGFDLDKVLGTEIDDIENETEKINEINELFDKNPIRAEFIVAYCLYGDREYSYIRTWSGSHEEEGQINRLYYFLEELGYKISDEELKLMDGSHELFGGGRE